MFDLIVAWFDNKPQKPKGEEFLWAYDMFKVLSKILREDKLQILAAS